MANGAAFSDAVEAARALPQLSVGCHVVLTDGAPVSPPGAVDTLLAIRSAEPEKFFASLSAFAARATLGGFDREQLVDGNHRPDQKNSGHRSRGDASRLAQARAHFP